MSELRYIGVGTDLMVHRCDSPLFEDRILTDYACVYVCTCCMSCVRKLCVCVIQALVDFIDSS